MNVLSNHSLEKIIEHLDYLSTEEFGSLREAHEHRIENAGWLYVTAKSLSAEVKRLREENKVLAKYRDIVNKYDDALLADEDEDPRWSELYD